MLIFLGGFLVMLGGLSSGAFYLPLKYVKNWQWETGWMIYSIFALLIGPWILAMITIPGLFNIIGEAPSSNIYWPIIFGFGWGIGGLTWGLSIRYLGIGLGNAFPLGLTSAMSTVIGPFVPIFLDPTKRPNGLGDAFNAQAETMFSGTSGTLLILSIVISLTGIGICGWAAASKDKELSEENKKEGNNEFDLKKGLLVAIVAGLMSACFAFGEYMGGDMAGLTAKANPGTIWKFNGVYAVLLIGGFSFNFFYTVILSFKNKSFKDFRAKDTKVRRNFSLAAAAGIAWFLQFVFKGMGTTKIPEKYSFITWSLLFTFVIVFSNIIGLITKEWKGVSKKTLTILFSGLTLLIVSVVLVAIASKLS